MEIIALRPRATEACAASQALPAIQSRAWHWLDLGWGLALIAASGADGGIWLFLAYPVAIAGLRLGRREGGAVMLAALAGAAAIGLAHSHVGEIHPVIANAALVAAVGGGILMVVRFESAQQARLRSLSQATVDVERRRISLDLHDGAIQPYLGLMLGLEALRRRVAPDNPLARDLDELHAMTRDSIDELRGYVRTLSGAQAPAGPLQEGLRRQVERFQKFYGFTAELDVQPGLRLDEGLAGDVVQLVGEGLSNVGRHTASRQVTVAISAADRRLVIEIINHRGGGVPWRRFTPASLVQRAARRGGLVEVVPHQSGGSIVRIVLPL
jgi:signal transduction histidine kinase